MNNNNIDPPPDYMPRYPGSDKLTGKTALINGGTSGIGRAVAILFAREGANLSLAYHSGHETAKETQRLVEAEGGDALLIAGDTGDKAHVEKVVAQTVEKFGGLNILINNAAQQAVEEDFRNVSEETLRKTFDTNVMGYFFMAQEAVNHMTSGDSIINTTSVNAFRGLATLVDYSATRGAILAFTRALSGQLAPKNIRVNGVAPGPIWTPLIPSTMSESDVEHFGEDVPLARPGQPNEVAPSYLFLACEDSSYFTGQTLHPNGGIVVGA